MLYLEPSEYVDYGLAADTSADWIHAATALIHSFCRRPGLEITQYVERLRLTAGARTVRLTYLPLAPQAPAVSPLVSVQGRYAMPRRGELADESMLQIASTFALPGQWSDIDPNSIDVDATTGELTLPYNLMGLAYNEVSVTYTAGMAVVEDAVKCACAQIVRNAQATPALNASRARIDTMQMQYFSSSLLDETVQTWLRPYVANRLG